MDTRSAHVIGKRRDSEERFVAKIEIERRESGFYCKWSAESEEGTLLGVKAFPIPNQIVPSAQDGFDFALSFAVENMRRARINRRPYLEPEHVRWNK
jgi:hypothetical protein